MPERTAVDSSSAALAVAWVWVWVWLGASDCECDCDCDFELECCGGLFGGFQWDGDGTGEVGHRGLFSVGACVG